MIPAVLPADLQARLKGRDLIVFDGVCVLCSGFFRFVLRLDRDRRFAFATAQSPLGQDLYRALGLPLDDFETNLVISGGQVHQRLDAFAAAMRRLPGGWPVFGLCRFLHGPLKDFLYHRIARNRYRLFGRMDQCLIPDEALRSRFLPDGYILRP
jgi:predicted DCC family thiol-disulfide oxidoreductase YuxK